MNDISIVIISYNTKDLLQACLESIYRTSKGVSFEVIVVDNASKDDSVTMVLKEFPQVLCIANKENLGFAKANNIGIAKAKGRYLLFLNSDTIVHDKTIVTMFSFMEEHEKAGAATCFIKLLNGTLDDGAHRGFPTPWNALCYFSGLAKLFPNSMFFNGYNLGWRNLDAIHEVDAIVGAFMLVRRAAGEQIGWWDEDYFFYGEDLDFCYKLHEKGWKIFFVPSVSILHYKGASAGIKDVSKTITTADKKTKVKATLARFDAMKIFYKKHYVKKYPKILTGIVFLGIDVKKWYTLKKI